MTEHDRRRQLEDCARLGSALRDLHARNDDRRNAAWFGAMVDDARDLLAHGFDDEQLRALGVRMLRPFEFPDLANPKAVDSGYRVDPWKLEARDLQIELAEVTLRLQSSGGDG